MIHEVNQYNLHYSKNRRIPIKAVGVRAKSTDFLTFESIRTDQALHLAACRLNRSDHIRRMWPVCRPLAAIQAKESKEGNEFKRNE